ncbi:peptidylprolyl isomerase [Aquihabitans sp. G128]|uniref:peptidylprolyl isomerase n=1 Tax=Aquihabitans sp. G128 TaxID=2849779 RepID=UPI001C23A0E1|nr:peptidylprolyl isomerase [Aquihabitans sp. G128]QXC62091.1 peptidylprolyl isomerase [Aquihabitans sp. G128]
MQATLHTNHGDIRITLFADQAPKTVGSFVGLAKGEPTWRDLELGKTRDKPFYDGVIFHRVIPGFMIQGGDPTGTGTGGPGYDFDDEIAPGLDFATPYKLAMANAGTRGGKGTNGSQFFITVGPTPHLLGKHAIFGEVADDESKRVVDSIASTPTARGDRPVDEVVINSVTIED